MKDSKEVRSEYQSFVDAYGKIAEASVPEPEKERLKNTKSNPAGEPQTPLGGDRRPMVKVRKEGAFTEQAEKYQMSVKQFARFVEANQLLFSVDTRKKAQVANAFQGFKETADWDEFFEDTEMVEDLGGMINKAAEKLKTSQNPLARAARALVSPAKGSGRGTARPSVQVQDRIRKNQAGMESLEWDEKEINDVILEVTTKETKSGTKYKVRVKHKDTGSSYIRYATREMIAQMRNDPKISSVEMTDEGDAPEDKGEKKALEKGGGDVEKSDEKQDTKQAADKGTGFAAKTKKRSVTTEAKKLDPVGKEDGDVDNDGDKDSSDEYLMKRRKAIGKAMKKEGYSNWRQDLTEVIKDQDEVGTIKEKGVKNKVEIMPKMEGYGEKTCKKCGKNPCECPKEEVAVEGEVTEGSYQGGGALRPTDRIKMGDGSLKSLKDIDAKLKEKNTKKEEVTTEGETLEEGPAALAIKMGLAAGTAIAGTKIGQQAIKKVRGMVQKKREAEAPYRKMLGR